MREEEEPGIEAVSRETRREVSGGVSGQRKQPEKEHTQVIGIAFSL